MQGQSSNQCQTMMLHINTPNQCPYQVSTSYNLFPKNTCLIAYLDTITENNTPTSLKGCEAKIAVTPMSYNKYANESTQRAHASAKIIPHKLENSDYSLYPDGDPDDPENLTGSKLDQDPSFDFFFRKNQQILTTVIIL